MKVLVLFAVLGALTTSSSFADSPRSYRSYPIELRVANGETKTVELQINPEVDVARFGDPEIAHHGFYNYSVTGTIQEAGKSCKFEVLLAQGTGDSQSTAQVLSAGSDRQGLISLCSGLKLEISSVRGLLTSDSVAVALLAAGLSQPIGKGTARFQGVKTIQEHTCSDPWHCPHDSHDSVNSER